MPNPQRSFTSLVLLAVFTLVTACGGVVEGDAAGTEDALSSDSGIHVDFFSSSTLTTKLYSRTDANVNFNWSSKAPAAAVPRTNFSARWTGYLEPLYSETYTFTTVADDGVRLWIAGTQLAHDWTAHAAKTYTGTVKLEAHHRYAVKLEYFQATGLAQVALSWQSAHQGKQIIPASAFFLTSTPSTTTAPPVTKTGSSPAGLFITQDNLARAKARMADPKSAFAGSYAGQLSHAKAALALTPNPFHMNDISKITYGWGAKFGCPLDNDGLDDTLHDLTGKLTTDGNAMRTLALQYALTGDKQYGAKALAFMTAWATKGMFVNDHDFHIDYAKGTMDDSSVGDCSDRPWNFALDTIFQTYGAINAGDTYLLLKLNEYPMTAAQDAQFKAWMKLLAAALNSGYQAWMRWADNHVSTSTSYIRYRSDNHLSWALAGLTSLGIAMGDQDLVSYTLDGGTWNDPRNGPYANATPEKAVIDRAILASKGDMVFEESICRDPPIGYSMFHLWAMELVAQMAQVHEGRDLWNYKGADGAGMLEGYARYPAYIEGKKTVACSTLDPVGGPQSYIWIYELAAKQWPGRGFDTLVRTTSRSSFIIQSIGPVSLLLGE